MGNLIAIIIIIVGIAVGVKLVFQKKKTELNALNTLGEDYEKHINAAIDLIEKELQTLASSSDPDSLEKMKRLTESYIKLKEIKFKN